MKRILIVSGSRADYGLLEWPIKKLEEDSDFQGKILKIWGSKFDLAFAIVAQCIEEERPDLMLILGDRFEILAAATAAHLLRVPIAHIGGGDVTEGSYDDAMRDAISRMASIHFVTSTSAMARLSHMGYRNVHLVGNPGIDYIRHADWKKERPIAEPYVVVNYQTETIDGTVSWGEVARVIANRRAYIFYPNKDTGDDYLRKVIDHYCMGRDNVTRVEFMPHDEYLNLISHSEELIGNSSSLLYEAPELEIKTHMIGRRQKGRTIPWGDSFASDRIVKILKYST